MELIFIFPQNPSAKSLTGANVKRFRILAQTCHARCRRVPIPRRHSTRADELQYQATGRIRIPLVRKPKSVTHFFTLYKPLKKVLDTTYAQATEVDSAAKVSEPRNVKT